MKAVVKYDRGKGFIEVREVPEPQIQDDEVLIEVKAVAICGSDLHIYHDCHPYWPPVILGHEFSGVITAVGKAVKGWHPGDRVVSETRAGSCGACYNCQSGYPQVCEGKRAYGIGTDGAFAKYVAVKAAFLHRLPETVSFAAAALTEPIAICLTSIIERSNLRAGESVLITGPGPIGLISLAIAKAAGAGLVGITGLTDDEGFRFDLARKLGVDFTITADREDPIKKVRELTGGRGVDLVIESSGGARAVSQAFEVVRRLGRVCAIGISGREEIPIPYDRGIFKAVRYDFCFSSSYTSWEAALTLMGRGLIPAEKLVTRELPLERWQEAFEILENRAAAKILLIP
jgi:L-iditol 2-dehydrogenase